MSLNEADKNGLMAMALHELGKRDPGDCEYCDEVAENLNSVPTTEWGYEHQMRRI